MGLPELRMNSTSSIGSSGNSTAPTYDSRHLGRRTLRGVAAPSPRLSPGFSASCCSSSAVVTMQGPVILGVAAVVAGLAAVAWAAVALMS